MKQLVGGQTGAACECRKAKRVEVKALPPAALVALPVAVTAQHVCRKLAKESKKSSE